MLGNGMRTLLNFDADLKVRGGGVGEGGVGLFPGCLVGLTGRNGGGRAFAVSEVIVVRPLHLTLYLTERGSMDVAPSTRRTLHRSIGTLRLTVRNRPQAAWRCSTRSHHSIRTLYSRHGSRIRTARGTPESGQGGEARCPHPRTSSSLLLVLRIDTHITDGSIRRLSPSPLP